MDGMSRSSLCQPLLPVFLISNFCGGNDPEKISGVEGGREGEEKRISNKDEKISQSIVNNLIEIKNNDSLQPGFPFSAEISYKDLIEKTFDLAIEFTKKFNLLTIL